MPSAATAATGTGVGSDATADDTAASEETILRTLFDSYSAACRQGADVDDGSDDGEFEVRRRI